MTANQSTPSTARTITIAALIMMGSVLLSRAMGMVRELVLAAYFGTGTASIEAYNTSFLIPEILNHLCAGGFLSVTFIPIFQRYLIKKQNDLAWRSFSNIMTLGTILMLLLVGLGMVLARPITTLLIPDDPQRLELAIIMTRIIMPAQLFFYWGAILMAVQYAQNKFFIPALLPLAYNAGIILTGLALYKAFGITGFAWGVVVGALVGNVVLQVPGALRAGMRFSLRVDIRDPDLHRYVLLTVPLILGLGMSYSNEIFFRIFGTMLDKGVAALCNYPLRTMLIVVAVFGQAAGVASYPFLSRLAAENNHTEMNRLLYTILSKLVIILIPLSVVMMISALPIMTVLFERGQFTAASSAATAPILAIYLAGALAFSCNAIIVRNFYAMQNTVTPMVISSIAAIASIPAYIFFARTWNAAGIALAAALFMNIQGIVLYAAWYRCYPDRVAFVKLLRTALLSLVATLPGAVICYLLQLKVNSLVADFNPFMRGLLTLSGSAIPAILLVVLMLHVLKLQTLQATIAALSRRRNRKVPA